MPKSKSNNNNNTSQRKVNAGRRQRNNNASRRRARENGLGNGAQHALAENRMSGRPNGTRRQMVKYGLDAFHPIHVPLPRAVAPYLTVRTTTAFSSADPLMLFGPMRDHPGATDNINFKTTGRWNNLIAIGAQSLTQNLNTSGGYNVHAIPIPGAESSGFLECVPAAISVQIMNDTALQTADGVFYVSRMKTNISDPDTADSRTVGSMANALISYSPPRILTGSKLALRAVQINAVPGDMTDLSEFTPIANYNSVNGVSWSGKQGFSGFNPIYVYNPNVKTLQYLVAVEWRVRVSPYNPLSSAVVSHQPTPDTMWSDIIDTAQRIGHGVVDVIDYMEGLL